MTTVPAAGSRSAAALAHLKDHPGLTAGELARALGLRGPLRDLLRLMEQRAQVVAVLVWDSVQGKQVSRWRPAPLGTIPPPPPPADLERRERERLAQRARRARARGLPVQPGIEAPSLRTRPVAAARLPAAACRTADPRLFFPPPGDEGAEAKAICAGCPARAACYALAVANGEKWGIWGGVNFDAPASATSQKEAQAS
jgi:hypothetical protein